MKRCTINRSGARPLEPNWLVAVRRHFPCRHQPDRIGQESDAWFKITNWLSKESTLTFSTPLLQNRWLLERHNYKAALKLLKECGTKDESFKKSISRMKTSIVKEKKSLHEYLFIESSMFKGRINSIDYDVWVLCRLFFPKQPLVHIGWDKITSFRLKIVLSWLRIPYAIYV